MPEIAARGKNEYNRGTNKQRRDVLVTRVRRLTHNTEVSRMCATGYCSHSPIDSQLNIQGVLRAVGGAA